MAASIGLPVVLLDYLFTTCVSLVVVSAVSMVGVILVVGLLITPAATAYLLSDRLDKMMMLAALFGVTSVIGGLYLCVWLDSAGGGAIMLFCTLQFLVVLTVAPKYGLLARWLRLRNLVPQQVVEDVLTTVLRNEKPAPLSLIYKYAGEKKGLQKALRRMVPGWFASPRRPGLRPDGQGGKGGRHRTAGPPVSGKRILRGIGTPETEVHATAHQTGTSGPGTDPGLPR